MPILNFIATEPNRLAMVPFAVLLLAIALGPLIARHHWERHYHKLCLALAGIVCFYYLLVLKQPARVVHAGMEYATFMRSRDAPRPPGKKPAAVGTPLTTSSV